ncbi:MAG: M16 family metallopeptidase, partial [Bryobacteraceae bacterium]
LAITGANLANQKEAVKQERRLSMDNRPYNTAIVDRWPELAFRNWGSAHSIIGSFDDLNAASVDDVARFFRTYYAPNNAVLAVVGDLSIAETKRRIESFFGSIPAQKPARPPDLAEPPAAGPRSDVYRDPLAQVPALIVGWPGPPRHSPDFSALWMADVLLTGGDSSRFQQNLVKGRQSVLSYEANLAWPFDGPSAYREPNVYAMYFVHKPDVTGKQVLGHVEEELAKIAREGVDARELERARTFLRAARIRELQSTLARATQLAHHEMFDGKPERITTLLDEATAATPARIQAVVKKYLTAGRRIALEIAPAPNQKKPAAEVETAKSNPSEAPPPPPKEQPPATPPLAVLKLPPMFETKLASGLLVVLAEDARFPLVTVRLAFGAGRKFDPADRPGLAEAVASLLAEGTKTRTSRQIAEEAASIGGSVSANAGPDTLTVAGSALAEHTTRLLDLVADVVRNPSFPADEVALYKQNRKQSLIESRSHADFLAEERIHEVVFGSHPYARVNPTPESIDALDAATLERFRAAHLVPNNGVLIVLGKLPPRVQLLKAIAARLGTWEPKTLP